MPYFPKSRAWRRSSEVCAVVWLNFFFSLKWKKNIAKGMQNDVMNHAQKFEKTLQDRLVHIAKESQKSIEITGFASFFIGLACGVMTNHILSASSVKR